MKRLLFAMVFGLSGLAVAGDLQDADKFLMAKAYDKAFPIYAKLAEAGNVEAQFRVGEMYWYGDGTAVDIKSATAWMQKAAARGHAGAAESLAILKQRETRGADIAYWTSGYKGEGIVSSKYNCPAPLIPELSKTNVGIKQTSDAYVAWQQCYNDFVTNINATPPARRIPADVLSLLTPGEAEQAVAQISDAYAKSVAQAQQDAARLTAQHMAWQAATARIVIAENKARKHDLELTMRQIDERELHAAIRYRTMAPAFTPAQVPAR